jgi:GTPase SAR1 family protein
MKVTMVGISGSGKTAYMSSLYEALGDGGQNDSGFYIAPRSMQQFDQAILSVGDFSRFSLTDKFKWPDGTQQTTVWPFTVYHSSKPVTYFDWIDYRGGILTEITDAVDSNNISESMRGEVTELASHIELSNAVILVVDAFVLTYYSNVKEARHRSGARRIHEIFTTYSRIYPDRNLTFVIMMTKADTVHAKWKSDNYAPLIERGLEVFNQMVSLCKENPSWEGSIVPVSAVGEGNVQRTITPTGDIMYPFKSEDKIIGFPVPLNAEHVLFYCLAQILKQMKSEATMSIRQREEELSEILQKAGLVNKIWSFITRKLDAESIARAIIDEKNRDYEVLSQFEPYIEPLLNKAIERVRQIK